MLLNRFPNETGNLDGDRVRRVRILKDRRDGPRRARGNAGGGEEAASCGGPGIARLLHALARSQVMSSIKLDADESTAQIARCQERGAGAAERIEHDPVGLAESLNERHERLDR